MQIDVISFFFTAKITQKGRSLYLPYTLKKLKDITGREYMEKVMRAIAPSRNKNWRRFKNGQSSTYAK